MRKSLSLIILLTLSSVVLAHSSDLKQQVEVVVISDWKNPNMEVNPNKDHNTVNREPNAITAYVQTLDGSMGMRLQFDDPSYNMLSRFDVITLDLQGAKISRSEETGALTVSGLIPSNVAAIRHGTEADVIRKVRSISQLTDADIYTWVTLTETEFVFKNGTYSDIQETYSLYNEKYHSGYKSIHNRMDCWPVTLRDSKGGVIYMLVNSLCDWRRDGDGVPQGAGEVSGIIVSSHLRRFGDSIGRYSIRPFDKESIKVLEKKSTSLWKLHTAFILDGSHGQSLTFKMAGEVQDVNKAKMKNDWIMNDLGSGSYLMTDTGAEMRVISDYNNLTADAEANGMVKNGAICFTCPLENWYEFDAAGKVKATKGVTLAFSAKKMKGTKIQIAFDIAAGNGNMESCELYPYEWKVEYSLNGIDWNVVNDAVTGQDRFAVRTVPTWAKTLGQHKYPTQFECGLGLQQHVFNLPAEVFGKENVEVRISPASDVLTAIHHKSDKSSKLKSDGSNVARPGLKNRTYIRFGTLRVDYK